jgi:hypothetical protein
LSAKCRPIECLPCLFGVTEHLRMQCRSICGAVYRHACQKHPLENIRAYAFPRDYFVVRDWQHNIGKDVDFERAVWRSVDPAPATKSLDKLVITNRSPQRLRCICGVSDRP